MRRKKQQSKKQNHSQEAEKLQCSHIYWKHFLLNIIYDKIVQPLATMLLSDPIPK